MIPFYRTLFVAASAALAALTPCAATAQGSTPATGTQTLVIDSNSGRWTASNPAKTWHRAWASTHSEPMLTLSTGENNMAFDGSTLQLFSGKNAGFNANYTISVTPGYEIREYSFDFHAKTNNVEVLVTPQGGSSVSCTSTSTPAQVSVTGLSAPSAVFNVKQGAGTAATFAMVTNFRVVVAQSSQTSSTHYLYITRPGDKPFRIPALAKTRTGRLLAFTDYRPSGQDIGFGEVDIQLRTSDDNGKTWTPARTIADGTGVGTGLECGFGDAAVVADRESDDVLMICVAGKVPYGQGDYKNGRPNPMVRFVSHDGGTTWQPYEDLTAQVYGLFDKGGTVPPIKSMFVGSGKLCQSTRIKNGTHYRIYAPIAARDGGNRVLFSDDFGKTWNVLGGADALPVPSGDEPKCEELPDGRILISSRVDGGRFFNIFSYINEEGGDGRWGTPAKSDANNSGVVARNNACNGEILILPVKRKSDNKQMYLALQSIPFGPNRSNVGIYYKALESLNDYSTPDAFARNWTGRKQVSNMNSAYSTMVFQADEKIGFYYEESTYGTDYTNVYLPLTIEEITDNAFAYDKTVPPPAADQLSFRDLQIIQDLLAVKGLGFPEAQASSRLKLKSILANPAAHNKLQLQDALGEYYTETDIEMPADGAKYIISFIVLNGKSYYLNYTGSELAVVEKDASTVIPESAHFTFREEKNKPEGTFRILTNDGKYLCVPSPKKGVSWLNGYNTTGIYADYSPDFCAIEMRKMVPGPQANCSPVDLFGLFYAWGFRGERKDNGKPEYGPFLINAAEKTFEGANTPFFTDRHSSAIHLERVLLPLGNTIKDLQEVKGNKAYSLYNAHFTTYAISKPEQNNVWVAGMRGDSGHSLSNAEFAHPVDPLSANSAWQLITDADGRHYLYNIGAQAYAKTPGQNGAHACTFTTEKTPIQVVQLADGFAFTSSGASTDHFCAAPQFSDKPIAIWTSDDVGSLWVLVENPNVEADLTIYNTITALRSTLVAPNHAPKGIYTLSGQRLEVADPRRLPKGLYIIDGRKHLVK